MDLPTPSILPYRPFGLNSVGPEDLLVCQEPVVDILKSDKGMQELSALLSWIAQPGLKILAPIGGGTFNEALYQRVVC